MQLVLCTATNKGDVIVEFRGALVYLSQDRRRYGHLRIPSQIDLGPMDLIDHGRKVVSLVARFLCLDWRDNARFNTHGAGPTTTPRPSKTVTHVTRMWAHHHVPGGVHRHQLRQTLLYEDPTRPAVVKPGVVAVVVAIAGVVIIISTPDMVAIVRGRRWCVPILVLDNAKPNKVSQSRQLVGTAVKRSLVGMHTWFWDEDDLLLRDEPRVQAPSSDDPQCHPWRGKLDAGACRTKDGQRNRRGPRVQGDTPQTDQHPETE